MSKPRKPKAPTGRKSRLRSAAEAQWSRTASSAPEAQARTSPRVIHELQVHQIQLEMQNEELQRVHLALEESRNRYQDLYDFAPVGYFTFTRRGRIVEVNLTGTTLLGVPRAKLIQRGLASFVAPGDRDKWKRHLVSVVQPAAGAQEPGGKQSCQLKLQRADGSTFHARLESVRVGLPEGSGSAGAGAESPAIRTALSDITERVRAREAIQEAHERLRAVLESITDAFFSLDLQWRFTYVNQEAERILGLTREQLMGHSIWEKFPPAVGSRFQREYERAVAENKTAHFEEFYPPFAKWFDVHAYPSAAGLSVYFQDITERHQTEEARRESEEHFRLVLEHSNDAIFWADAETGILIRCNRKAEELTGRTRDELIGMHQTQLHPPDQNHADEFRRATALSSAENIEAEVLSRAGKRTPVLINTTVVTIGQKKIIQGIFRDITVRKQTENALRESEAQLRLVLEHSNDAIFWADAATGNIVRCNHRTEELTERSRAELIGMHVEKLHPPGPDYREVFRRLAAVPSTENVEAEFLSRTGKRTPVVVNFSVVTFGQQGIVQGIARDITEPKRMEAYREMGREALRLLNEPGDVRDVLQALVVALKERTGFDAVGLRLQAGEDFPYVAQEGFSNDFLRTENTLIARAADGGVCRNREGQAYLECLCGLVIAGQTDPANPCFTPGGSWWTNDYTPLLALRLCEDARRHPRNRCIHQGYASVALIPIRVNHKNVGLIQLNDRRKGCFTLNSVELLEAIASHIGAALMRKQAEQALRQARDELEARVRERTAELQESNEKLRREIVARRKTQQRLAATEFRYRTVAEFTRDWEYWESEECAWHFCSPSCERLTGYSAQEFIANPGLLQQIIHPEDRRIWQEHREEFLTAAEPGTVQFRIVRKDGQVRWIEHAWELVTGPDGRFRGVRASNRDITDRRQQEFQTQRLREELGHVTRVSTAGQLAAALSHELRQPLTAISCNIQAAERFLAAGEPDLAEVKEALSDIRSDSERACGVIHGLSAMFHKTVAEQSAVGINDVIQETTDLLHSEFVLKGTSVQLELAPGLPSALGNHIELQQVVVNLIVNALEAMTERPPPARRLHIRTDRESPVMIRASFADSGPGIPEALLGRLFDSFFTTKPGGMGMGLAICQSIIEEHGGRLWAVNNPDQGATFHFTLPIRDEERA